MSFTGGQSTAEICDALEESSAHYVRLLEQVKNPGLPAVGNWNVGVTVMHTAASGAYFLTVAQGKTEPMAIDSDHSVYDDSELKWDLPDLIARFKAGEKALVGYGRTLEGDPRGGVF